MAHQKSMKKVCVIGAGTMGSGIAAHLANLGFDVTLLDATQSSAVEAFERAKQAKPPRFYVSERSLDIRLGNVVDHLDWVSEADWVCEAVVERLGVKRSLFGRIEPLVRADAFVTTNTSGIQISLLSEGMSEGFRRRFMGTHFFNPPRYLKLLELIPTEETDPHLAIRMKEFLEEDVARRVVVAKDTPGFIANRYGMWCMYQAIHTAEKLHLSVEQVDAMTGPFLGRPKSATFRLNDIVGLDVMQDIALNLLERCPNDPHIGALKTPASVVTLMDRGWIGDKVGQGYYRKEAKEFLAFDLSTHAYRQKQDVDLPGVTELASLPLPQRLTEVLSRRCETGEFMRNYLVPALKYADYLKQEVSHGVDDIDRVMKWGFGWEMGPFEMIDAIGPERLGLASRKFYQGCEQLGFDDSYHPIAEEPQYLRLADCPVVNSHETFNIRELGDGVQAVCFTTKLGVITPLMVDELSKVILNGSLGRFVLTSEARSFSAGFDLRFFAKAIAEERWIDVDLALDSLQKLGELLEKSTVVAAIYGHCLGAGLELALSCPQVVTLVETQIGLPESKVGLLPGGRGVTLMRLMNQHTAKRLSEVTYNIAAGMVSGNAEEARALGYLRGTDTTVFHPDRLLFEAKKAALEVEPRPHGTINATVGPLSGMIDRLLEVAVNQGVLSEYDETIGQKLKFIVAKATTYEDCLAKERSEFLDLCGKALTVARINHMLANGTALRN